ncbi:triggering receptor expressed on myeloid cells 2 isoform X1 [Sarcophilus harrisii]|uniref:Triggering receptor expressed on myeloid cells 2 n=1 Tax=Sarcophilus harrisii TaxID=9305 RepID=G3X0D1_SARHA|nr:triggering receptor expressed on myeloid cells 2 isoform X1 [Sarcophilus harrisii]
MWLLSLLILLSITELSHTHNTTVLQVMEGQTLSISCPYDPVKYWGKLKSWCRQHEQQGHCQHVISARRSWLIAFLKKWNGSTAIADDALAGRLTITLKDLRPHDTGLYQCQSHQNGMTDTLRKIMVEVLEDSVGPQSSGDSWIPEEPEILEKHQSPEEPNVQSSVSRSLSETRNPLSPTIFFFLVAGLLLSKFLAVGFLWIIAWHKKSQKKKPECGHSHDYQLQPLPGQDEV